MALKDVVKVNRKTFFDPRGWLGYDTLKQQTTTVVSLFNAVFRRGAEVPENPESFDEAVKRLKLSHSELENAQKNYLTYALFFLTLAIMGAIVGLYFLFTGSFFSFLIIIALCVYLCAQAFSNHFYYFQIKNKKLGVTFEEWRNKTVKR